MIYLTGMCGRIWKASSQGDCVYSGLTLLFGLQCGFYEVCWNFCKGLFCCNPLMEKYTFQLGFIFLFQTKEFVMEYTSHTRAITDMKVHQSMVYTACLDDTIRMINFQVRSLCVIHLHFVFSWCTLWSLLPWHDLHNISGWGILLDYQ